MNIIKRETLILDLINKYTYWLVSKFTPIAKKVRLTPEKLGKMIFRDIITEQEKGVLTEMLYNKEVVLAWDFTEWEKLKKKYHFIRKFELLSIRPGKFWDFRFQKL